ncbi:MAG: hypothetical protein R3F17_12125 [Planctomycetota bacterium]
MLAWVQRPRFADAISELSEWYWEGMCDELSDEAARMLQADPTCLLNFESLAVCDMDCGGDLSAVDHVLAIEKLSPVEILILRKLVEARVRIMRVGEVTELGSQRAVDRNSGTSFFVSTQSWPVPLTPGRDYLVRLIAFPGIALWAGPCFELPEDPTHPVRREAEELVAGLMTSKCPRQNRESLLVDFSHTWAGAMIEDLSAPPLPAAPFTLLRGA